MLTIGLLPICAGFSPLSSFAFRFSVSSPASSKASLLMLTDCWLLLLVSPRLRARGPRRARCWLGGVVASVVEVFLLRLRFSASSSPLRPIFRQRLQSRPKDFAAAGSRSRHVDCYRGWQSAARPPASSTCH